MKGPKLYPIKGPRKVELSASLILVKPDQVKPKSMVGSFTSMHKDCPHIGILKNMFKDIVGNL
jgi:hypothetical protein